MATARAGRPSILLLGAGGHARACIDVVEQEGRYGIAGLTGTVAEVGTPVLGYQVLGDENALPSLLRRYRRALIAVGQIQSPDLRIRLCELALGADCELPVIVSPRAYVSPRAELGAGTIVMHGAVVNAGASIGRNCIVNSQALVEHDAVIGDHCHVATNATLNGGVSVGEGTFIGSGTTVRQIIRIGSRCVIGMGQRIIADCADGTHIPALSRR